MLVYVGACVCLGMRAWERERERGRKDACEGTAHVSGAHDGSTDAPVRCPVRGT